MRTLSSTALLAAAFALLVCGCGNPPTPEMRSARREPSPSWRSVRSVTPWQDMVVSLLREGVDLDALRRRATAAEIPFGPMPEMSDRTHEVTLRMSDAFREWSKYREELTPAPKEEKERRKPAQEAPPTPEAPVPHRASEGGLITQQRHLGEYTNLRIRIALLESRLTSAAEAERGTVRARLSAARQALKALEGQCLEEARGEALAQDQAPAPSPATDEQAPARSESVETSHPAPLDRPDPSVVQGPPIVAEREHAQVASRRASPSTQRLQAEGDSLYLGKLDDTRRSVGRAIRSLRAERLY